MEYSSLNPICSDIISRYNFRFTKESWIKKSSSSKKLHLKVLYCSSLTCKRWMMNDIYTTILKTNHVVSTLRYRINWSVSIHAKMNSHNSICNSTTVRRPKQRNELYITMPIPSFQLHIRLPTMTWANYKLVVVSVNSFFSVS